VWVLLKNLWRYLRSSTSFWIFRFGIPRPPFFLGWQTISHTARELQFYSPSSFFSTRKAMSPDFLNMFQNFGIQLNITHREGGNRGQQRFNQGGPSTVRHDHKSCKNISFNSVYQRHQVHIDCTYFSRMLFMTLSWSWQVGMMKSESSTYCTTGPVAHSFFLRSGSPFNSLERMDP
jgi:hypothetical protein